MEPKNSIDRFYSPFKKGALLVNQVTAGAGTTGLLGFALLGTVASLFFITENFFISLLLLSFAVMVYVTGMDFPKIILSSFTLFFSSKHLVQKAAYLQETLDALLKELAFKRDESGQIHQSPLAQGGTVILPDNPLVRELQKLSEDGKDFTYTEFTTYNYYVDCHELYSYAHYSLDFVSNTMPLFGIIGTVLGLISTFDSIGADVNIELLTPQLALALKTTMYGCLYASLYRIVGSRFEQRSNALDYDHDTLCRALEVLVQHKAKIEIAQ